LGVKAPGAVALEFSSRSCHLLGFSTSIYCTLYDSIHPSNFATSSVVHVILTSPSPRPISLSLGPLDVSYWATLSIIKAIAALIS
jgi:hypothetical protein